MSRAIGSTGRPFHCLRGTALPEGWTMSAKGLWHHENGARVEATGMHPAYRMTDADGVRQSATTRAEAFAWASGETL